MNQALLGAGASGQRALSPCSEDDDTFLPVGSNLWESMKIPSCLGENIEDLFSIETLYNSSLPKNKNVLCPPKTLPQELFDFTQGERLRAEGAVYPGDLEKLKVTVSLFWIPSFCFTYMNY